MNTGYPLTVYNQRQLPDGYNGPIFIWDIDKTYLSTHFSSFKGLTRIPLEFAVDKFAIPGMPAVLRGLRRGLGPEFACSPIYFVSASPPQLRRVLEEKMLLDGVEYDGIVSKDWFKTMIHFRFGRLKEQLGYKLCALLTLKQIHPLAEEYLFGDDVEKDPKSFYLYAQLIADEISYKDAEIIMIKEGVKKEDREHVFLLKDLLPAKLGTVKRIFIHLEKNTPPDEFSHYGHLVAPVKGAWQLSLALYEMDMIDPETLTQASKSITSRQELINQTTEAQARGLISENKYKSAPFREIIEIS